MLAAQHDQPLRREGPAHPFDRVIGAAVVDQYQLEVRSMLCGKRVHEALCHFGAIVDGENDMNHCRFVFRRT